MDVKTNLELGPPKVDKSTKINEGTKQASQGLMGIGADSGQSNFSSLLTSNANKPHKPIVPQPNERPETKTKQASAGNVPIQRRKENTPANAQDQAVVPAPATMANKHSEGAPEVEDKSIEVNQHQDENTDSVLAGEEDTPELAIETILIEQDIPTNFDLADVTAAKALDDKRPEVEVAADSDVELGVELQETQASLAVTDLTGTHMPDEIPGLGRPMEAVAVVESGVVSSDRKLDGAGQKPIVEQGVQKIEGLKAAAAEQEAAEEEANASHSRKPVPQLKSDLDLNMALDNEKGQKSQDFGEQVKKSLESIQAPLDLDKPKTISSMVIQNRVNQSTLPGSYTMRYEQAFSPDKNWSNGLFERVSWLAQNKIQSAQIQIDPEELGPLKIELKVHKEQASLIMTVHSNQVRDVLETNAARLKELLQEQGFTDVQTDVREENKGNQPHESEGFSGSNEGDGVVDEDAETSDSGQAQGQHAEETLISLVNYYI